MKYACGGWFGKASFTFAYSLPLLPLRKPKHASGAFQSRVGFHHPPTPCFLFLRNFEKLRPKLVSPTPAPWVFSRPICWYRSRLDEQQTAPARRKPGGAGSIGPRGKFFHNKSLLGTAFCLTGSQTIASPFTPPLLLHIQILKVLGVCPSCVPEHHGHQMNDVQFGKL